MSANNDRTTTQRIDAIAKQVAEIARRIKSTEERNLSLATRVKGVELVVTGMREEIKIILAGIGG